MNNILGGKSLKREAEEISTSNNIIGKGTVITGNIETSANIRIEGKVVGDVKTKAKVAIGESAHIKGNVYATNAEVEGNVDGIIEISELLTLKSTAVIEGDIITNKIAIESGARFNGACKMGSVNAENVNGRAAKPREEATV